MGVSGCGKTTVAIELAKQLNYLFIEADDFHSEQAKAHMASGKPLTDNMRLPWIERVRKELMQKSHNHQNSVLSFSGLRRAHRQALRNIFDTTIYLHMIAPYDVIMQRMTLRDDHFMPPELLESQLAALEPNINESDMIDLDATQEIAQLVHQGMKAVS